jgi:fused signal recognition particle receptor
MSGFFKKLFNRITGKKEEAPPPPTIEALPEPEAAPEPVVVPEPEPQPEPERQPEPVAVAPPAEPEPEPEAEAVAEAVPVAPREEPRPAKAKPAVAKTKPKPKPETAPPKPAPKAKAKAPEPPSTRPDAKAKAKAPARSVEPKKVPKRTGQKPVQVEEEKPKPAPKPEPVISPEPDALEPSAPKVTLEPPAVALPPEPAPQPAVVPAPVAAAIEPEPPPAVPPPQAAEEARQRRGWFSRLKEGLSKSSKSITGSITSIFTKRKLDKETLQDLEDVLLQADLGLPMAERIVRAVSEGRYDKEIDPEEVKRILASEVAKVLKPVEVPFNFGTEKPYIILVVGVNGAGKTTTIGKLGAIATREGFKVMFAACDTFRAAAIEQLTVWGQRIGAKTMARPTGADASGLAFDAIKEAKADGTDIVFIDTAGRLQNKAYLMDELDKIVRVIKKQDETAPHAVLLVLDATTGQNAMAQADIFTKVAGVTGIIMTKLDGTARGGILVAIAERFKLPVHAIGVGETVDDLQPFEAEGFARAIAGLEDQ